MGVSCGKCMQLDIDQGHGIMNSLTHRIIKNVEDIYSAAMRHTNAQSCAYEAYLAKERQLAENRQYQRQVKERQLAENRQYQRQAVKRHAHYRGRGSTPTKCRACRSGRSCP